MKLSQLQRYKKEAAVSRTVSALRERSKESDLCVQTYKEQLDKCQETISQLRQTIYGMEKYNEPV